MNAEIAELIETANRVSVGLIKVAASKPNDHPLQSNAETFRGAANLIRALTLEVTRVEEYNANLVEKLQRIANLKVRNASEAIEAGDWKSLIDELQAVAQEALTPNVNITGKPNGQRDVPRRPSRD